MMDNIFSAAGQMVITYGTPIGEVQVRRRTTSPLFTECMWLNGELVPAEDVMIRGHAGFFEEIRCYPTERGPAIFRLEAHLERFLYTARSMRVGDLRYDMVDLRRAVHVTVHVNNLSACIVRPILFMDRQSDDRYPTVAVVTGVWHPPSTGLRLMASTAAPQRGQRMSARQTLQNQAARMVRARDAAIRAGFDEAVLLNPDGDVVDCTAENLFLVRDGIVYTSRGTGDSRDVARHTALTLVHDLGYPVSRKPLHREHLLTAEEAFLCGTSREITPVLQIDGRALNDGRPGPLTGNLRRLYTDTVHGRGRRSRGWLEYVMMEPLY